MRNRQVRQRNIPFRILFYLWYGDYTWAEWDGPTNATLKLAPLGRLMRLSASRLREHLEWLAEAGYFSDLSIEAGSASLRLRVPPRWASLSREEIPTTEELDEAVEASAPAKAIGGLWD